MQLQCKCHHTAQSGSRACNAVAMQLRSALVSVEAGVIQLHCNRLRSQAMLEQCKRGQYVLGFVGSRGFSVAQRVLQVRMDGALLEAFTAQCKKRGRTVTSVVTGMVRKSIGEEGSNAPSGGDAGAMQELAEAVRELAEAVRGGVTPALVEGSGENPPVSAEPAAEASDAQQLVAGVRAKSKAELDSWLNLSGSEEGNAEGSVVITPSPAMVEAPVRRRKGNPAFAAALRAAAEEVGDQVEQALEHPPAHVPEQPCGGAVDSAVGVEVSVEQVLPGVDRIRVWRQEQVGKEAPEAPPVSSGGDWVTAGRDLLRDRGMAGDLGEVTALLGLWKCPLDLLAGEVGELLEALPNYEKL